jgi:TPR repeat protein
MYFLAEMYEKGLGVQQDEKTALKLYAQAATAGKIHQAMYAVGKMHSEGRGTKVDANAAATWMQRAALNGSKPARAWLEKQDATPEFRASPVSP